MSAITEFAVVVESWFDGDHRHDGGPTTFRVVDGRIADISYGDHGMVLARQGIHVERGGFLMPGLVDAHVHLFLDGGPTDAKARAAHLKQPVEALVEAARRSARQSFQCGVTLVRDAGDRHGINHRIREEAAREGAAMSQVRSGGLGIKRARRYGAFMATDVTDDASIRQSVTDLAAANDEIKIILTGVIDFDAGAVTDEPQFNLDEARQITAVAKALGRKTFAHCSGIKGLEIAARAGVGSIEHGFFMTRSILETMLEHGVAWTPTFGPVYFQWRHPESAGWSAQTVANLHRILDAHAEHLRIADEIGLSLLLGTDAGSMGVEHGHAVFDEIERYLEAGLSLEAALRAGTSSPRRHFGLPCVTLKVGAWFDAVLLAESPFHWIAALREPQRVWGGTPTGALGRNAFEFANR